MQLEPHPPMTHWSLSEMQDSLFQLGMTRVSSVSRVSIFMRIVRPNTETSRIEPVASCSRKGVAMSWPVSTVNLFGPKPREPNAKAPSDGTIWIGIHAVCPSTHPHFRFGGSGRAVQKTGIVDGFSALMPTYELGAGLVICALCSTSAERCFGKLQKID